MLRDAVLTAIGTLALASIAVIHLVQIVPTFKATPLLGGAFVLLIAGAVALAATNGHAMVSSEQRLELA